MATMPPINPEREALAHASNAIRQHLWENKLRIRYKFYPPEQVEEIVAKYRNIIADLDEHIEAIDRQEAESRKASA
jgi:hypothetical protein